MLSFNDLLAGNEDEFETRLYLGYDRPSQGRLLAAMTALVDSWNFADFYCKAVAPALDGVLGWRVGGVKFRLSNGRLGRLDLDAGRPCF